MAIPQLLQQQTRRNFLETSTILGLMSQWFAAARLTAQQLTAERPNLIRPSAADSDIQSETLAFYKTWKERYLRSTSDGESYVEVNPNNSEDTGFSEDTLTVSEAHGYGMLLTVMMADTDPSARQTFDAMVRFYEKRPSTNGAPLMAYRILKKNSAVAPDGTSATDGDLDIALALLMAHARWKSGGTSYRNKAMRLLSAITEREIHPQAHTPLMGDWAAHLPNSDPLRGAIRTSDVMPGHFQIFKKFHPEGPWERVRETSLRVLEAVQNKFSPRYGLLPDFIRNATGKDPSPPTGQLLESNTDGAFSYNATRFGMRLAMGALVSTEAPVREQIRRLNKGLIELTGGDPNRFYAGYTLEGRPLNRELGNLAFLTPALVAAMIPAESPTANTSTQKWLDALWEAVSKTTVDSSTYYGNTLKMLAMATVAGHYERAISLLLQDLSAKSMNTADHMLAIAA